MDDDGCIPLAKKGDKIKQRFDIEIFKLTQAASASTCGEN